MAVKKKSRKSRVSKGIHGTTRACRKQQNMARLLNQLDAFIKGKNVRVTVERDGQLVKVSGEELWGKHVQRR